MRNQHLPVILFGTVLLIALIWRWLYVEWSLYRTNLAMMHAQDQIEMFYRVKSESLEEEAAQQAASVSTIESYFPSGTRQISGSPLDRLVESIREETARDIFRQMARTDEKNASPRPTSR